MRHSVLPPTSLVQVLTLIADLSDEQFAAIRDASTTSRSFELSDKERSRLSEGLGLPIETISYLYSALYFLYRQLSISSGDTETDIGDKVDGVLSDLKLNRQVDNDKPLRSRLISLLRYDRIHETYIKVARLEEGFIASLIGASSFVDLRPSFNADRTSIDGFVPLIQLNITTDSPRNFESQIVIQLDLDGLRTLKKAISDIDTKVHLLRNHGDLFLPIYAHEDDE